MKSKIIFIHIFLLLLTLPLFSQPYSSYYRYRNLRLYEKPLNLVDTPTANFLDSTYFQVKLRMYGEGGMLTGFNIQVKRHIMIGVSYGGQNVIGYGTIKWNEAPGIQLRFQVAPEIYPFPAFAIGFNSQGYGAYYTATDSSSGRYQIKPKGFYVAGSYNYTSILGGIGLHVGLNYNNENKGTDQDLNFFLGASIVFWNDISILLEHDFAINDNDKNSIGTGKGYTNAAIRWFVSKNLLLEFSVKNLLKNNKLVHGIDEVPNENREIKLIYFQDLR